MVSRSHALLRPYPDGVVVHEVRNIVTRNGLTTEVYRSDWGTSEALPQQALFVTLRAGALSAWPMHHRQVDQIFVVAGALKRALFDPREGSATRGQVFEWFLESRQGRAPARDRQPAITPFDRLPAGHSRRGRRRAAVRAMQPSRCRATWCLPNGRDWL